MDYPKSVAGVGLVNGKFIDENEQTGQQGSLIPALWGNDVTDEILAVQVAGGQVPDETKTNQLLLAIQKLIQQGAGVLAFSLTDLPTTNIGPIVVKEVMEVWGWSSSAYFTGYRSPLCGRPLDGHTASPLPSEVDATGGVLSKTAYAGLWGTHGKTILWSCKPTGQRTSVHITSSMWMRTPSGCRTCAICFVATQALTLTLQMLGPWVAASLTRSRTSQAPGQMTSCETQQTHREPLQPALATGQGLLERQAAAMASHSTPRVWRAPPAKHAAETSPSCRACIPRRECVAHRPRLGSAEKCGSNRTAPGSTCANSKAAPAACAVVDLDAGGVTFKSIRLARIRGPGICSFFNRDKEVSWKRMKKEC